jgi:hypothetical protein
MNKNETRTRIKPYVLTYSSFEEEAEMIKASVAERTDKHKYKFRLYDDDGELCYKGLCVTNNSFYPLDEEQPNSGVTEIHYLNEETGKFEQL